MDLKNIETDYEHQRIDDVDVNPYELVIALAKKAREINAKAQKYLGPETAIKPVNIVLNKLNEGDVEFRYSEEGKEEGVGEETDKPVENAVPVEKE